MQVYLAQQATHSFFNQANAEDTSKSRLYSFNPLAQHLNAVIGGYQSYLLVMCAFASEWRTVDFVGHHVCTLGVSVMASCGFVHYYVFFFAGVAEWSTVALGVVDLYKTMPREWVAEHAQSFLAVRVFFALAFLPIRGVMWPCMTFFMASDMYNTYPDVHSKPAWAYIGTVCVLLTMLQFTWGVTIVKALAKAAGLGGTSGKGKGD